MRGRWEKASKDLELKCPEVQVLFKQYSCPACDEVTKAEATVNRARDAAVASTDQLLQRREAFAGLIAASEELSRVAPQFERQTARTMPCWLRFRRCCTICWSKCCCSCCC